VKRRRLLIYLAPMLMDMVLAQFFFANAVRLARMGKSATGVAGVLTVWGAAYLLACPVAARWLTVKNSARQLLAACVAMAVLSVLHIYFASMVGIYVLMGCAGIATALFFPAFQIFMKAVDAVGAMSIAYSAGLYTFAWSMGYALGPFVGAVLVTGGAAGGSGSDVGDWNHAFIFGAVVSLMAAGLVLFLKHLREQAPLPVDPQVTAPPRSETSPLLNYARMPDLAWLGWLGAGVGVLVLSIARGVFPARAVQVLNLSVGVQGVLFFLISVAQACFGLACCRSRLWMYRAVPVLLCGLAGILGTICLGFGETLPVLCVGAILVGLYSGSFYFYLVFHSLAHPQRSAHYVAVNESVVGLCSVIGPLLGGLLADRAGFGFAYLAGAVLTLLAISVQAVVHRRHPAGR